MVGIILLRVPSIDKLASSKIGVFCQTSEMEIRVGSVVVVDFWAEFK